MKIGIIGSMQYTEAMLEVRDQLKALGYEAFVTDLHKPFIGKSDEEKERIKIDQKNNQDAIREMWRLMQGAEAVLVVNLDKHGIKNYIGGNTFLEMGFAHVLKQKIYLYNPIPDMPYYKTEIEAMKPVVINQDLTAIDVPDDQC
jgi:nucleoside 2-deoxyribosyltransferase